MRNDSSIKDILRIVHRTEGDGQQYKGVVPQLEPSGLQVREYGLQVYGGGHLGACWSGGGGRDSVSASHAGCRTDNGRLMKSMGDSGRFSAGTVDSGIGNAAIIVSICKIQSRA